MESCKHMKTTPTFPPEFFQPAELREQSGYQQAARIVRWLKDNRVPYVLTATGWPLVYRTAMMPGAAPEAQNVTAHNFGAFRRDSRRQAA